MEITPEMLADLKAKAQKATPGPWSEFCGNSVIKNNEIGRLIIAAHTKSVNDARHIAATSPDVVLALIDKIEELKASLSEKRVKAFLEMVDRIPLKLQDRRGEYEKSISRLEKIICYDYDECEECPLFDEERGACSRLKITEPKCQHEAVSKAVEGQDEY